LSTGLKNSPERMNEMQMKLWKIAGIITALAAVAGAVYLAIANYDLIVDYFDALKGKMAKRCPFKLCKSADTESFGDFADIEEE